MKYLVDISVRKVACHEVATLIAGAESDCEREKKETEDRKIE
jgi:hypothetical protein